MKIKLSRNGKFVHVATQLKSNCNWLVITS